MHITENNVLNNIPNGSVAQSVSQNGSTNCFDNNNNNKSSNDEVNYHQVMRGEPNGYKPYLMDPVLSSLLSYHSSSRVEDRELFHSLWPCSLN